jgi:hypothetical protein
MLQLQLQLQQRQQKYKRSELRKGAGQMLSKTC